MSEENPTNKPPPPELRQVTPGMQELAQVEGVRIMMDRCAHSFALGINSPGSFGSSFSATGGRKRFGLYTLFFVR